MKKHSLDIENSEEQITKMKTEDLESACGPARRSPEQSSVNDNYKSKKENDLKENHDNLNLEDGSGISIETDPQKEEKGVSVLDHLRHTTITTCTSSRKRKLRDSTHQSSQKNMVYLQKSTDLSTADALDQVESTLDESKVKCVERSDVEGLTSVVPLNNEDDGNETTRRNSEPTNIIDEEKLSPGCKQELLTNGRVGRVDDSVKCNGKLELPKNGLVFKKKRRPIRKQMNNAAECVAVDKVADSQGGQINAVLDLSNSNNIMYEKSIKSEGDEHLPLLKRARVRMGKTPGDESQPSSPFDADEKSETSVNIDNSNMPYKTPSGGHGCPPNGTSLALEEELSPSTENNSSLPLPRDISFWKSKKYQLNGFDLDVEAALPPSKRLHRALEAMSANAAETREDSVETQGNTESNGFKCSPKRSSPKISSEEKVGFVAESVQSSESNGHITDASELMPQMFKPALSSSGAKLMYNCSTSSLANNKCNGIFEAAVSCNGKSISGASINDFQKTSLQSCSSNLPVAINATSSKGLTNELCSLDLVNKKECPSLIAEKNNNGEIVKPVFDRSDSDLKPALTGSDTDMTPAIKVNIDNNVASPDEAITKVSAADAIFVVNNTLGSNKPSDFHSKEDSQTRDMQDMEKEATRLIPGDKCYSPELTPMKELIAAAQAKRFLSHSASLYDNHVLKSASSPCPSRKFSPPVIISHNSATDDEPLTIQSCGRSPQVGLRLKDLSSSFSHSEAYAARKAFEAFLCTLSRTKESIGRATRLAIDCAKYGIAGEVIDIIVSNLEREPHLYKRVDLFFLVDSITQCSRNQRGGAADVYCSLVQAVLPRLLSFAAPHGSAAFENRKQCLKVLRLWLERKTLPESIIRHHIQKLDMLNETTFPGGSSRRPLRTERAFNDPVREMEGILVDEYGSNTSMQLPNLLRTNVLEDEEGSTSDDEGFEAVTPERDSNLKQEEEVHMSSLKRQHVLEDIDGELEMEDVAPRDIELGSSFHCPLYDTLLNTNNQNNEHLLPSFAPPPPDRLPSSAPLPSSPTSLVPLSFTSPSAKPHQQPTSDAVSESSNLLISVSDNGTRAPQREPLNQQPIAPNYAPGYAGPKSMPPPVSVCAPGAYGNFPGPPIVSGSLKSKPYSLPPHPPPPTISNQFSYTHAEAQRRQPWHNCSSFQDKYIYRPDNQRGNFYGDRGTSGPFHQEVSVGSRFPSVVHPDSLLFKKVEGTSASLRQYGPPRQPPTIFCNDWSVPPRLPDNSGFRSMPPIESPASRATGASRYWIPR